MPIPKESSHVKRGAHQQNSAWAVSHCPAANTTATITRAAPGVGKRLVVTSIDVGACAGTTAPTAAAVTVSLTDGALTVHWKKNMVFPATAGIQGGIVLDNEWIIIPENTAVTLAFSVAGGANTFEDVNMRGITETLY